MKYLYNGGPEHVDINPADVLEVSIHQNKRIKDGASLAVLKACAI